MRGSKPRLLSAPALFIAAAACSSAPRAAMPGPSEPDATKTDAALDAQAGGGDDGAPDGAADAGSSDREPGFDPDSGVPRDAAHPMRTVDGYVALGSSSTYGSGASSPEHAYVAVLTARLTERFPSIRALNLGSGGATIGSFLASLDRVRKARPDVVTILPFTDYVQTSPDAFRSGYTELLDALGTIGATVFFGDNRIDPGLVCGVGRGPGGCYSRSDRDLLATKNAIVRDLAASRPFVIVVPIFDQNVAHPEWIAADHAHPNDLGHQYLADSFWKSIARWLK